MAGARCPYSQHGIMAEVRTRCDFNRDSTVQTLNLGLPTRHKNNFEPQTLAPATAENTPSETGRYEGGQTYGMFDGWRAWAKRGPSQLHGVHDTRAHTSTPLDARAAARYGEDTSSQQRMGQRSRTVGLGA